jgi:hypothetical protein
VCELAIGERSSRITDFNMERRLDLKVLAAA